jgi:hypothetical protein
MTIADIAVRERKTGYGGKTNENQCSDRLNLRKKPNSEMLIRIEASMYRCTPTKVTDFKEELSTDE